MDMLSLIRGQVSIFVYRRVVPCRGTTPKWTFFLQHTKKGVLRGVFRGDRYKHIGQGLKIAGRGVCGGEN